MSEIPATRDALSRRILLFIIRLTVAAAAILWLLSTDRLSLSAFATIGWDVTTVSICGLGLVAVAGSLWLRAVRLRIMLHSLGMRTTSIAAIRYTLVGVLLGIVLPGLIGGDTAKAVLLYGDEREHRPEAIAAVTADRMVGVLALFILGAIASLMAALTGSGIPPSVLSFAPAVLGGLLLLTGLAAWSPWKRLWPLEGRHSVTRFIGALHGLAASPGITIWTLALSLCNHLLLVLSFVCADAILDVGLGLARHLTFDPIGLAANLIPISPSGIGVSEGVFSYLYQTVGVDAGADVALLGRIVAYVVYVAGGAWALATLRTPNIRLLASRRGGDIAPD